MVQLSLTGLDNKRKQKKSIDQRAPQIGYEGIKSFQSLDMKNYLVTGGLLSLVKSCNNTCQSYNMNFQTVIPDLKL